MNFYKRVKKIFGFETRSSEFELLETESGQPGYMGGWRECAQEPQPEKHDIPPTLKESRERLMREYRMDINPDVVAREFQLGGSVPAIAVFVTGMANNDMINDFILRDGMRKGIMDAAEAPLCEYVVKNVFTMAEAEIKNDWVELKIAVSEGRTAVLIEGEACCILMDTRGFEHRSVEAPQNEKSIKGPQEGFSESIRTNITLVRRIIKTDDLVCELRQSGGGNNLKIAVIYREGVTNQTLVNEVKRRLGKINTRSIISAGVLEQLIEEHGLSPFPQLLSTERPDRAAAYIMQGHVAVMIEGSPFANVMPVTLHSLMASPEDSYVREPQGTVIRVVRYIGAFISVLLPAYFLSLALHHQGLLSVEVLSTLVSSRKMIFAPLGTEMIFLLLVFQLIREAGLRVPGSIGQAIGIIGGLILGQAAVAANLASSVVLIIVALSGLGNFCVPDYSTQIAASYFRIGLVFAAWWGGLLGLTCTMVAIVCWMCSLKSFGVPFLAPFSPKTYSKYPLVRRGPVKAHSRATDFTNTKEDSRI